MARQIFFINRFFYPDHSATSQMLSDLAFHLASHGTPVTIITSRQLIDDSDARLISKEEINNVKVFRVWTTSFGRAGLIGRAIDYLSFYLTTLLCLFHLVKRGDTVVAKTDPPLISLISAIIVKLKGAYLINWLQDIFPEVAVALNVKGARLIAPILVVFRNYTLRLAINNVVLGEKMAELVSKQTLGLAKTTIIPNWSDGDSILPIKPADNKLRKAWKLEDKFVVGYSGNMGRAHDFETILQAANLLKDQKDLHFLFIGSGAQKEILEKKFNEHDIHNVIFQPYQDRDQLAESLSCPDVHMISLLPELEGVIVPSKFYGIAAAGRASLFIGDLDGEISRIIDQSNCGISIKVGDAKKLAKTILDLKNNRELCADLGVKARNAYDQKYNKQMSFKAWSLLLSGKSNTDTAL